MYPSSANKMGTCHPKHIQRGNIPRLTVMNSSKNSIAYMNGNTLGDVLQPLKVPYNTSPDSPGTNKWKKVAANPTEPLTSSDETVTTSSTEAQAVAYKTLV